MQTTNIICKNNLLIGDEIIFRSEKIPKINKHERKNNKINS